MNGERGRRGRAWSREDDCEWAQAELEKMGDRRPGRLARIRLRRHAAGCAQCAGNLARMDAVLDALSSMERVSAPEGFTELVLARLAEVRALPVLHPGESGGPEGERRRGLWWIAVAGAGVAVAVGLAVWRHLAGHRDEDRMDGLAPVV